MPARYLVYEAGWELLLVGAASIVAGVLYTGGPRPYGYEGLGEVFVFLFFGVVAVMGSYFVQTQEISLGGVRALGPGRPARVLVADGQQHPRHRHRPSRRQAHARGAARPGEDADRLQRDVADRVRARFRSSGLSPSFTPWINLALLALPLQPPLARTVRERTDGAALNKALADSARLELVFCVLLSVGLIVGSQ